MRVSSADQSAALSGVGYRDAESLFRSKPISEIRNVESNTRKQIDDKKEELRQLIGNRYRDLIDSADSILSMKSSCELIYSNVSSISDSILSLSSESPNLSLGFPKLNPNRAKIYGIACRVKYLVDTPENIWGCLDESMFLEAAARYVRARLVHQSLNSVNSMDSEGDGKILSKQFPLLNHQWQIVESFRAQISQRSRERLMSVDKNAVGCLTVGAFADALAGVAVVDDFDAKQAFSLFLDSRKSWIMQKLNTCGPGGSVDGTDSDGSGVVSELCEITKIILVTVAHVGELFLHVLNDKPLFFKMILESPPASQLFGGIPNPDEEVRLWTEFRNKLESAMVNLDREYIAKTCSEWLKGCRIEIINKINDKCLLNAIANGGELASAENMIRETMDSKDVLDGSLEWLKSVFGSNIELPWNRTRELVLEENIDLWDEIFEDAFVQRITVIIDSGFAELNSIVNVTGSVTAIGESSLDLIDFQAYMNRSTSTGSVWFADPNVKKSSLMSAKVHFEENDFDSCLNAYLGPEASRIREAVDSRCRSILEDLLCFLESPKSSIRLKDLAPYLQNRCHKSLSTILKDLKNELAQLRSALDNINKGVNSGRPASIIEKSLFIGRLLFALQNHSKHIPVILGSPKSWANEFMVAGLEKLPLLKSSRLSTESPLSDIIGKQNTDSPKRQTSRAASALFGSDDHTSSKLEEVIKAMRDLSITAHGLWISWLVEELSAILTHDIRSDDGLSTSTSSSLKGWEEITVKQDGEGSSELKISLPNTPSMYITSFLFRACGEIHRVGGHVLDRTVLQQFALRLLESVMGCYQEFFTSDGDRVSEKGILQMLLDLRFAADILSGGDSNLNEGISKGSSTKYTFRRKQEQSISTTASRERLNQVLSQFWQKLDPIDWQTYEPYLWENVKQSYMRHAVLFGFFVQLNRMYTDTLQKLPSNSESNLMRCSTVPRFKYLPISGPVQSSRVAAKTPLRTLSDDIALRSSLKSLMNGDRSQKLDIDDSSGFGAATPFLKSFMQVGSRFGESTFKLGSISSSFGEILPMQAAGGFLSSLTTNRSDS